MNAEMKRILGKFIFTNAVIACVILFFCGSITAAQRTAYNAYLKEYAVLSMVNRGQQVEMEGFSREISFTLPQKAQMQKLVRCMKLTPLASVIFFGESLEEISEEFLSKCIDINRK